jgi:hypothetical protein
MVQVERRKKNVEMSSLHPRSVYGQGGCRILVEGQLSDYNGLSGSNSIINRILNKIIII